MSRYRTIQCLVWQDDKFPFAGDEVQLLWFQLMTTPLSTPLGIFYAPIAGLAAEKGWSEEKYRKRLGEGLAKGFWKVDERSHVVYFPKYFRYHKPDNPNIFRGWLKCWDEIPECSLKDECYQELTEYCKIWGEGFAKVLETLPKRFGKVPETVTVTGTATGTVIKAPGDEKATPAGPPALFPDFKKPSEQKTKPSPKDEAYELFCNEFLEHRKVPYHRNQKKDFVRLAAVRTQLGLNDAGMPEKWQQTIHNYFETPLDSYTLADLCVRYDVFFNSALDRFGKPKEEENAAANQCRANAIFGSPEFDPDRD